MHPTSELYESLQKAYEHFNKKLFNSKLVKVIFTVQRQKGVMGYFAPERWGNLKGVKCHEIAINPSYIANARLIEVMQTLVHEMVHCWQHCFGNPGRTSYHDTEWAKKMIRVGLMPSSTGEPGGKITGQHMSDYIIEGGAFLESYNDLEKNKKFKLKWIDRKSLPRLIEPIIANPDNIKNKPPDLAIFLANNPDIKTFDETKLVPYQVESKESVFSEILPNDFVIEQTAKRKTRQRYICNGCNNKIYGKANLNVRCEDCDQLFVSS